MADARVENLIRDITATQGLDAVQLANVAAWVRKNFADARAEQDAEIARLQALNESLTERVAAQSELLSKRAEMTAK